MRLHHEKYCSIITWILLMGVQFSIAAMDSPVNASKDPLDVAVDRLYAEIWENDFLETRDRFIAIMRRVWEKSEPKNLSFQSYSDGIFSHFSRWEKMRPDNMALLDDNFEKIVIERINAYPDRKTRDEFGGILKKNMAFFEDALTEKLRRSDAVVFTRESIRDMGMTVADFYEKAVSFAVPTGAVPPEKTRELVAQRTHAFLVDVLCVVIDGCRQGAEKRFHILAHDIFYSGVAHLNPVFRQDRKKQLETIADAFFVTDDQGSVTAVLPDIHSFSWDYCALGFLNIYDEPVNTFSEAAEAKLRVQEKLKMDFLANPKRFNFVGKKLIQTATPETDNSEK